MPIVLQGISEERLMELTRNALLVAGAEMGPDGDHQPVIKSTIHSLAKDWEELKIERAVHAEMKRHLYSLLEQMEGAAPKDDLKVKTKLRNLREIYDAYFTEPSDNDLELADIELPIHVKRAEAILDTLGEAND